MWLGSVTDRDVITTKGGARHIANSNPFRVTPSLLLNHSRDVFVTTHESLPFLWQLT